MISHIKRLLVDYFLSTWYTLVENALPYLGLIMETSTPYDFSTHTMDGMQGSFMFILILAYGLHMYKQRGVEDVIRFSCNHYCYYYLYLKCTSSHFLMKRHDQCYIPTVTPPEWGGGDLFIRGTWITTPPQTIARPNNEKEQRNVDYNPPS